MNRLLILLLGCLPLSALAQFAEVCLDSSRVNTYYQCNNDEFRPVCGCNAVTYRNTCDMNNVAGVNNTSATYNGVCQNDLYFYFISPTLIRNNLDFKLQLADQQTGNGTLQIYNSQGNIVYGELLNSLTSFPFIKTYDFTQLESGVYILVVQVKGVYRIKKFIKHNYS